MLLEFFTALGFVFIAEMGDKTQILAMAFSTKYKIKYVVLGIALGSFLNHSIAVILGYSLNSVLPLTLLANIAGFAFIIFGLWSLKMSDDEDEVKISKYGPILTVSLAFFIGELGDKTQLTAIALSSEAKYPIFILLGTVSAMVIAGLLGIFVGRKLGSKVPEFYIKLGAGIVFFMFGFVKLFNNMPNNYLTPIYYIPFISLVLLMAYMILKPTLLLRKHGLQTPFQKTAENLKLYYSKMESKLDDLCLGLSNCGKCDTDTCIVAITKKIIKDASNNLETDKIIKKALLIKDYDNKKAFDCLKITVDFLKNDPNNELYKSIHIVRNNFEMILFGKQINSFKSYDNYLIELNKIDKNAYKMIV